MDFDALSDFRWFQQADFGCSINQAFKEAFAHSKLGLFRHPFGDGIVVIRYALLEKLSRHPLMQSQIEALAAQVRTRVHWQNCLITIRFFMMSRAPNYWRLLFKLPVEVR